MGRDRESLVLLAEVEIVRLVSRKGDVQAHRIDK